MESAKQLYTTIFIPVVEHAPTLKTFNVFALFFPFLFIYHSFHGYLFMYGQNDFLHSTVNEVASMAAILVQKLRGFFKKKKTKNPCFALNHLIYIFSIYIIFYIYI